MDEADAGDAGAARVPVAVTSIATRSGLSAVLDRDGSVEVLRLADSKGRLLLEVREASHGVVFAVSEGDLILRSDRGRVRIEAAEGVEIEGDLVTITAKRLRNVVGVIETNASRIFEKTRDVYREVSGLSQLRAEDVRIVANGTLRMLAERLRLKAKKEAKIDGEKIYLG